MLNDMKRRPAFEVGLLLLACVAAALWTGRVTYLRPDTGAAVGVGATVLAALLAALAIWWSVLQANSSRRDALIQRTADHRLAVLRDLSDLQDLALPETQRRLRARILLVALAAPDLDLPALRAWADCGATDEGRLKVRQIVLTSGRSITAAEYDKAPLAHQQDHQAIGLRGASQVDPGITPWSLETEAAILAVLDQRP